MGWQSLPSQELPWRRQSGSRHFCSCSRFYSNLCAGAQSRKASTPPPVRGHCSWSHGNVRCFAAVRAECQVGDGRSDRPLYGPAGPRKPTLRSISQCPKQRWSYQCPSFRLSPPVTGGGCAQALAAVPTQQQWTSQIFAAHIAFLNALSPNLLAGNSTADVQTTNSSVQGGEHSVANGDASAATQADNGCGAMRKSRPKPSAAATHIHRGRRSTETLSAELRSRRVHNNLKRAEESSGKPIASGSVRCVARQIGHPPSCLHQRPQSYPLIPLTQLPPLPRHLFHALASTTRQRVHPWAWQPANKPMVVPFPLLLATQALRARQVVRSLLVWHARTE